MHTIEAIQARRAVKQYDPNFVIPAADETRLLELARLAPTAFNLQHWRFVVVKDKALRAQIREVGWDQPQMTDASLLVILTGNLNAWQTPRRVWQSAGEQVQDYMAGAVDAYYNGKERVQHDEVMRSAGMAGQTLMLAATAMGYQTCPMDGFDFDAVGKLIHLPQGHVIAFMVAIGKGTKAPQPRPTQLPLEEVVITDRFPQQG